MVFFIGLFTFPFNLTKLLKNSDSQLCERAYDITKNENKIKSVIGIQLLCCGIICNNSPSNLISGFTTSCCNNTTESEMTVIES
ncbi:hypothetical protein MASR2M117_18750 [Paludibacter sp.]